ncbi:hypothetical protein DYB26_000431 [Aphanomyces astaci]|uniref:Uncharacterized protein n=2 Tax=Aphanomyces astaci TaxID=112090 RepID=A0A397AGA1_APHAT|nr:hypothetical protein DYB36_010590 [Aphanomyces astaci]RHY57993.1 hypothetical protein DYB38_000306 [Aphanomyces astaci]RHY69266.1 hypothetical protein DYB34_004522 [Aphanomyces astaci]RHZ23081.1 hypothetical protein DYB26_000431 [Aphanomyces astaci]RHZ41376.1 hypothetical protein DYB31_000776 [Aphanomyces astaci]
METRHLYEVKSLRASRLNIAKRPKSAHISHRGELVLGLSPRANRANYGVNDSPTKYHPDTRHRVVQRYCVLDHTTVSAVPLPPEEDTSMVRDSFKCKVTRAGNLLPRQPSVKTLRQQSSVKTLQQPPSIPTLDPPTIAPTSNTPTVAAEPNLIAHAQHAHTTDLDDDTVRGDEKEDQAADTAAPRHRGAWTEPPPPSKDLRINDTPNRNNDAATCVMTKPTPTASLCLSAYQARKQAEECARRLANRLSFLNMEKARAEQEAERLHIEFYREQDAKIAFERQKLERAARVDQERQRVAAKHSQAVAVQLQNRSNVQELEEDKKARDACMMQAKLKAKHNVLCQHERTKRQRQLRERQNRERLELAQSERLRKEVEREKMAKHLVAKMQAQETSLKTMLEFQEHQQRIDMQRCFDMDSYAMPDEMTPS